MTCRVYEIAATLYLDELGAKNKYSLNRGHLRAQAVQAIASASPKESIPREAYYSTVSGKYGDAAGITE